MRPVLLLGLAMCAITLSACDEPSNVGANLVDEQSGVPFPVPLPASGVSALAKADVTGAVFRTLAGTVDDPAVGRIEASAFFDFDRSALASDAFLAGTVTEAALLVSRDYDYGDTTSVLTVRLRALADEWAATNARADTTLSVGDVVTTFALPIGETDAVIPLPSSWVASWDAVLRSETFATDFHGFAVEGAGGNLITGFQVSSVSIRAIVPGDTAFFPATRALTTVRTPSGGDVAGRQLLQDGRNAGVRIQFDFADQSLANAAVNRVRLAIPADTTLSVTTPAGFVRPIARTLELVAVSEDPPARLVVASPMFLDTELGRFYVESGQLSALLRPVIQSGDPFDYFELRVPISSNTLDVVLLGTVDDPDWRPTALLTLTPVQ